MTNHVTDFIRQNAKRIIAIVLIAWAYWFAQLPELPVVERKSLADRFKFARQTLPEVPGGAQKSVRAVHPSLRMISAWISSVGASVALNDLDGDGLPNDVCSIDPRTDQVIITPVPGTPPRYQPFALDHSQIIYDAATMAPMGVLPGDLNEDGLVDILVYYAGRPPVAFLRRSEQASRIAGQLTPGDYAPCEVYPHLERWNSSAATLADLDGDGHADLILGNYFQDGARLLDTNAAGAEQMQASMSRAYNGGRNRLFRWEGATVGANPTVRFKEVEGVLDDRIAHGWTLAIGAADLDGDLLPEIYFANDFGPDRLLHNRSKPGEFHFALLEGRKTFTTPNSKVLGRDSFKGMGVDFGDLNGDGWLDIYVSNITDEYAVQESHFVFLSTGEIERMKEGIAPYVDRSEPLGLSRSGWGWESRLGDFDNDSVLEALQATGYVKGSVNRWPEFHELVMGNDNLLSNPRNWPRFQPGDDLSGHNRNPFFVRASDGRYYDIAQDLGIAESQMSRGIATADVDGDGRLDYAVANQWGSFYFYRNQSPVPGAFLGLRLLLPLRPAETRTFRDQATAETIGRFAVSVSAVVKLPDGRKLVAQVDGGNGHSGKRSFDLHFGLGRISPDTLLQVDLRWRDPHGQDRSETLNLQAGWHTVMLGWSKGRGDR
jgi:hypothetical protein